MSALRSTNRRVALIALSAVLVGASACSTGGAAPLTSACFQGSRISVVSLSSSERSPEHLQLIADIVASDLASAAVCDQNVAAIAVAGGAAHPLVSNADIADLQLDGPNQRARETRVDGAGDRIHDRITDRLDTALHQLGEIDSSSVERLYDVAAEHTAPGSRVLIITDGVHRDGAIDLDRVLEPGEGSALAASLQVTALPPDVAVTVAGIGHVDAATPAPGATWIRELTAFNHAVCERAATAGCSVLTTPDATAAVTARATPAA